MTRLLQTRPDMNRPNTPIHEKRLPKDTVSDVLLPPRSPQRGGRTRISTPETVKPMQNGTAEFGGTKIKSPDFARLCPTYADMTRHDPTFLLQTRTNSYTPGNIRKALVQLCQTPAQPSPRRVSSAILKILENPANPDSDNHASPRRTLQKCCFSLPHPIELHALWVCDAGGQLPKVPCSKK